MYKYLIALFLLVINHYAIGASDGSQIYAFIENNLDNAYFITTTNWDPRFSGSNKFSIFSTQIGQKSLGYIGNNDTYSKNQYVDIWLKNSSITMPFIGIRCLNDLNSCPSNSIINDSSTMLDNGVYHIRGADRDGNSQSFRATLSESFYKYLAFTSLNEPTVFDFNYCSIGIDNDYNPSKGETCQNKGGNSRSQKITVTKVAHLKFAKTSYLEEIFIDTNGKPNLINTSNSHLCSKITLNKIGGIGCKLLAYSFTGSLAQFGKFKMKINATLIPDKPTDLQYSDSLSTSASWNRFSSETLVSKMFKTSNNGIYVFFSENYLKKIVNYQENNTEISKGFSFQLKNALLFESGYYEFIPSNQFLIKSKEHSISIMHSDNSLEKSLTSDIGNPSPITFDYTVSVSSKNLANKITAKVSGPTIDVNGNTYCKFTSEDEKIVVPFPAYLSFKKSSSPSLEKKLANCDNKLVDIKEAYWDKTKWSDSQNEDEPFLWRMNLALNFPMDDPISLKTVDSQDWEGSVSAAGTITVNAEWLDDK